MRKSIVVALITVFLTAASGQTVSQAAGAGPQSASPSNSDVAGVQAQLGFRLLQELAKAKPSQAILLDSPASVAAVFAFLDLTADAAMHRALVKTLGFAPEQASTALEALRTGAKELGGARPGSGPLEFANAVFIDPAGRVRPTALEKLKTAGMEAHEAQLGKQAGVDAVNAWVSEQTAGLIPSILDKPLQDPILVALNALHFKDKWLDPFDSRQTAPRPFHLVGGGTAEVPMMELGSIQPPIRRDDRFIGVMLAYETPGYSLTVVTTKNEPGSLADFAPAAGWLAGGDFQPSEDEVFLSLPKFDAAMRAELLPPLERLGLNEGYSPTAFEALAEKPLRISAVVQKTVVKVNETGTEAAAATAVEVEVGSALRTPRKILEVTVDKPFIFALRDDRHGLILLVGYVGNPSSK